MFVDIALKEEPYCNIDHILKMYVHISEFSWSYFWIGIPTSAYLVCTIIYLTEYNQMLSKQILW